MKYKYIIKHFLLLNLFMGLFIINTNAQPGVPFNDIGSKLSTFWPSSVSASQLFRKPAENIEHVTGRATIRIPLYEIRTADFVLPISIYFVTSGVKSNQLSGNIGTGWQLEAEPMITRTVRGHPDEFYFLTDSAARYARDNSQHRLRMASGQADVEQDIFYYRLLSDQNKFILDESNDRHFRPILFSNEGVRITTPSARLNSSLNCPISITDPSGNLYVFGRETASREMTFQGRDECVTSWKASEILSPNGDYLRFSYIENAPNEYPYSYYCFYMVEDGYSKSYAEGNILPHPGYWKGMDGRMNYYYLSDIQTSPWGSRVPVFKQWDKVSNISYGNFGSRVSPRPIKRIDFAGGSVRFIYNSNATQLQRIEIYSGNSLIRSIRLSTIGTDLSFLDKVEIFGSDEKNPECYRFDYFPNRKSSSDINYIRNVGQSDTGSFGDEVLTQKINITDPNGNADISFTIGGKGNNYFSDYRGENLCRIVYPSGGYTNYDYEYGYVRTSFKENPETLTAVKRLKSIIEHPVCSKPITRTFKYGDTPELLGFGYTRFPIAPMASSKEYIKHYIISGDYQNTFSQSGRCRLYTNQNFLSTDEAVYYSYVLETIGETNTLYKFNCFPSYAHGEHLYFSKTIDEELAYAKEISKEYYKKHYKDTIYISTNQTSYQQLRKTVWEVNTVAIFEDPYGAINNAPIDAFIKSLYLGSYSVTPVGVVSLEQGYTFNKKVTHDGSDVKNRSETRTYSTTSPRQLQSINTDHERIDFVYPDFKYTSGIEALMKERNELNTPVETLHYVDNKLLKRKVFHYEPDNNTNRGYSLSCIEESTTESGDNLRKTEQYSGYLRCGKPSQVTQLDGTTICFVWAYGGIHPIATIIGMTTEQVSRTGINLEETSTLHTIPESIYTLLNGLRSSHPEARVTTYRYIPMIGQVQQTDPNGVSVYYDYDNFGRLSTIKNNDLNKISTYEYHETNPQF